MPDIIDGSVDAIRSRQAIHDLLMAYARGVDRADADLLDSIFYPEATVITGVIDGSGREFARGIVEHVRTRFDSCFHLIGNEWIKVNGDHAVGESYVIAITKARGRDGIIGGRYLNDFERRDGVWKIMSHTIVRDWSTTRPTSSGIDSMFGALKLCGCFGPSDPLYRVWRSGDVTRD